MPGFFSELNKDPVYTSLPDRIDEDMLKTRVQALRAGDMDQVQPICVQLMRLCMSLVSNYAHPRRTPDLIGVALLTLVESVTDAAKVLEDDNIIPYVSSNINYRLKDYIQDDHTLRVPGRTVRYKNAKGIKLQLHTNSASPEDSPSGYSAFDFYEPRYKEMSGPYYVPAIAKPDRPSLEVREILEKIVRDDRDKMLIELRSQRCTLKETAATMGISRGLAHALKEELAIRFDALNVE